MNGFIGALAAQLALKPVSPAADGIAPRPRRPMAECLRAQRTAREADGSVPTQCIPAAAPARLVGGQRGGAYARPSCSRTPAPEP